MADGVSLKILRERVMAEAIDNEINSFCPEPDTCQIRITGLNRYCRGCRRHLKRIVSDFDGPGITDRLEWYW